MSEEKVFARRASGLVRGLSLTDAFGVGFMNQGLTPSMWVMISLGLSVYTGGNLIIATILSALFCGIGFSLVWGILGGSMPRSGGEYIYNSRIISPLIGIAESFGNAFVWIMWIYVLAPWTVDPGLVMLFQFLGMPEVADWCNPTHSLFRGRHPGQRRRPVVHGLWHQGLCQGAEGDHGLGPHSAHWSSCWCSPSPRAMGSSRPGTTWRRSTARSTTTDSWPRPRVPWKRRARCCPPPGTGLTRWA